MTETAPPLIADDDTLVSRLTEKEKECLRLWLQHNTAKEIALDLGISHHAVEKRLKMARTKLDVTSSIEAARLLAKAEGYGQTGYASPDLAQEQSGSNNGATDTALPSEARQLWRTGPLMASGVIIMSVLTVTAIGLLMAAPAANLDQNGDGRIVSSTIQTTGERTKGTEAQVSAYISDVFRLQDKDNSGFLEAGEVNVRATRSPAERTPDGRLQPTGEGQPIPTDEAARNYIARGDGNGDGKLNLAEYTAMMQPMVSRFGIPKNWRGFQS